MQKQSAKEEGICLFRKTSSAGTFSPAKNWMNDPNGLVYHNGEYHLFINIIEKPFWGPMHWGHAVSRDLVHWNIAYSPLSRQFGIHFSGSAVVDSKNTSGLGSEDNPPLIAFYVSRSCCCRRRTQKRNAIASHCLQHG